MEWNTIAIRQRRTHILHDCVCVCVCVSDCLSNTHKNAMYHLCVSACVFFQYRDGQILRPPVNQLLGPRNQSADSRNLRTHHARSPLHLITIYQSTSTTSTAHPPPAEYDVQLKVCERRMLRKHARTFVRAQRLVWKSHVVYTIESITHAHELRLNTSIYRGACVCVCMCS